MQYFVNKRAITGFKTDRVTKLGFKVQSAASSQNTRVLRINGRARDIETGWVSACVVSTKVKIVCNIWSIDVQ